MTIKKIAFCTDFSENADAAFDVAHEMAEKYNAHITILHTLPPVVNPVLADIELQVPETSRESLTLKLEKKMQEVYGDRIKAGIPCQFVVLDGHVSTEILAYLEKNDIDLVVLGAYGLTGVELVLFGSVAKRIAHKAPCSVMIIRDRRRTQ